MTSTGNFEQKLTDTQFDKSITLTQMQRNDGSLFFYPRKDIVIADYDLISTYIQQTSVIDTVETKQSPKPVAEDAGWLRRQLSRLEPMQIDIRQEYRKGSELYTTSKQRFIVEQSPEEISALIQTQKDHVQKQKLNLDLAVNFNKAIELHKVDITGNRKPLPTTIENYENIETIDTVKEDVLFPSETRAKLTDVSRLTFASGNQYIVTENTAEIQAVIDKRKRAILDQVKSLTL